MSYCNICTVVLEILHVQIYAILYIFGCVIFNYAIYHESSIVNQNQRIMCSTLLCKHRPNHINSIIEYHTIISSTMVL